MKDGKYGKGIVYRDDDIVPVHTLEGCEINLAEIFYDIVEMEDDSELVNKQKLIEILKSSGVSDEQIKKSIKMLEER